MPYDDDFERDIWHRIHLWSNALWIREWRERDLHPDARLDETGWDIFYCAVSRGMDYDEAAALAMDGTYFQRRRVRADMFEGLARENRHRFRQFYGSELERQRFDTRAPDQLAFWSERLRRPSFVYFIQDGAHGAVKIGLSTRPERRLSQLQTGNPEELQLRHVLPGGHLLEKRLHRRFEPARIRGEWFGRAYLPIILAFGGGLAEQLISSYDGTGRAPRLQGAEVRGEREALRIRRDVERMWNDGHDEESICEFTGLGSNELAEHIAEMRASSFYELVRPWNRARRRRAPKAA